VLLFAGGLFRLELLLPQATWSSDAYSSWSGRAHYGNRWPAQAHQKRRRWWPGTCRTWREIRSVPIHDDSDFARENNPFYKLLGVERARGQGSTARVEMRHMAVPRIESTGPSMARRFKFSNYFHNFISVHIDFSNYFYNFNFCFNCLSFKINFLWIFLIILIFRNIPTTIFFAEWYSQSLIPDWKTYQLFVKIRILI
jgi:hypothetical protein